MTTILSVNRNNAVMNNLAFDLYLDGDEKIINNTSQSSLLKNLYNNIHWISLLFFPKKTDQIICVSNSPLSILMFILSIRFKRRKLLLHDPHFHVGEKYLIQKINTFFYWVLGKSSKIEIVVDNDQLKNATLKLFPKAHVRVAKLPFSSTIVHAPTSEYYHNMAGDLDPFIFFYGRLEEYKGINRLLEIIDDLPDRIKLVLAGKNNGVSIPMSDKVLYLGFVPDEGIRALIKAAKAVVFPYSEATGTQTIPTVRALGTPVIKSDIKEFNCYKGPDVLQFKDSNELIDCIRTAITKNNSDTSSHLHEYSIVRWRKEVRK